MSNPASSSRYVRVGPLNAQHALLEAGGLRLEPLTEAHVPALVALFDPAIWRWYSVTIDSPLACERFVRALLAEQTSGSAMAYAARVGGEVVGSTSYLHIDRAHRRVEIGSTWWAPKWQRTFVNTTAKRLMLDHAFEVMGAIAVELRTDALNVRSRRAIERLGAKYCGILPAHRICEDGRVRDTVVYTITDNDRRA